LTSKPCAPLDIRLSRPAHRGWTLAAAPLALLLALSASPCLATTHKTADHKTSEHKTTEHKASEHKPAAHKPATHTASAQKNLAKKTLVSGKTGKAKAAVEKVSVKSKASEKTRDKKVAVKSVSTDSFASDSLAALTKALSVVPKSFFADKAVADKVAAAEPADGAGVVMNAAPVPYRLVAGQSKSAMAARPMFSPLSDQDAALYRAAYSLIDQGDYTGAEAQLAQVDDKSLMGYVEYHKLFSRGYTSTYDELIAWLNTYGDQPMAMKVWNLAKRKKPDGAPDPAFPSLVGPQAVAALGTDAAAVALSGTSSLSASTRVGAAPDSGDDAAPELDSPLTPKSARSAYNNGDLEGAARLGRQIGDHWVAGLALWRLHRYDQALKEFRFVATDPSRNAWSQAGGAYWAGRCALKLNQTDDAQNWFKISASFPFTFYGLVAEARLGVTPAVTLAKKGLPPTFNIDSRDAIKASMTGDFAWAASDTRARRLDALVQIGRTDDAEDELQSAIQHAGGATDRDNWLALAARTHVPFNQLTTSDWLFDTASYPLPTYKPRGGYTVDKALLYAFARKESKFNPDAYSYAGAYGLLQLMPSTAALVENDSSFAKNPKKLLNPNVNLQVGQDYINRLQDSSIVSGDLLRTIAAYNAGPRPVKDALDSLNDKDDSLLMMESIPVAQTRQYVEEVAASYWIYRQLMGQTTPSLTLAANDAAIIDVTKDN
jgi:soluble lytic murein transglycosylase-like protein